MNKPKIVGFIRCGGFDHLVRFVTDAPQNEYKQNYVVYQDGYCVKGGYMFAGNPNDWIAIESVSNIVNMGLGKSEESELRECQMWINAGLADIGNTAPHVIDESN